AASSLPLSLDTSGTTLAGSGVAARVELAARGVSPGVAGWNWAPLARRADGAPPFSSSVTDLMNSSSSTWSAVVAAGRGAPTLPAFPPTRASSSSSFAMSASTACSSSRTDTSSARTSLCTWRHSSSRRWITAVLFDDPLGIPLPLEARCRPGRKLRHPAEGVRREEDPGRVLQALHADPRGVEGGPYRHRPVVREQPRIAPREEGLDPVPQLGGPRRAIRYDRHPAALQDKLGQDKSLKALARDGEPRRGRRVRVHHGAHVGPAPQDPQV